MYTRRKFLHFAAIGSTIFSDIPSLFAKKQPIVSKPIVISTW